MISVLILTLNEEVNLPACLESVKWCDDIVVFDSFSTDNTVKIAKLAGARVFQRQFDNERAQRAASLQVPFKYPWVYNPDADEIPQPELQEEMLRVVAETPQSAVAFRVRFKTMFCGRWIRHSSLYPTWVVRLFQPNHISFERSVNLRYRIDGPEGRLQNHFIHSTFNKGIDAWFAKHNRYSSQEAVECIRYLSVAPLDWTNLFSRLPVLRRRALKELSFRLPCRPVFRFLYMYILRLGFFDGSPGYNYCLLLSTYEQMIVLKMGEIRRNENPADHHVLAHPSWWRRHGVLLMACGLLTAFIGELAFSSNLLCVESPAQHAQVIIVLGGETKERAKRTLELYQQGAAARIIISGDGEADEIGQVLIQAGVSPEAIQRESRSKNTQQNAEFTIRLLRQEGVRQAIIVTSWFHSRRALNTFCFFAPEIHFASAPTREDRTWPAEATHISQEYLKTVWYYFRYGVSPWRASLP